MNEKHFNFFKSLDFVPQGCVGRNALNFGNKVQDQPLPDILNRQFDRNKLFELCADQNNTNLTVTVAILAWGGMRVNHAKRLFQNWNFLDQIVTELRAGYIGDRKQAFSKFKQARAGGKLPGMGIAYFTKLICFLKPDLHGYILDQWTGKSINLLFAKKAKNNLLVDISTQGWVTDKNDSDTYDEFCIYVKEIAEKLKCSPIETEERLFSVGCCPSGEWRQYLKSNYNF